MTPIDKLLDAVDWKPVEPPAETNGLPYVTHQGVLEIFGHPFDVMVLNDGQRVFTEDSLKRFFGEA